MSYPRVMDVVTQQGNDIAGLINDACEDPRNLLAPRALVAQCIAESDLDEDACRWGAWPDVSFGILQQTVLYAPVGDQSQSPTNIAFCQEYYGDVRNAIPEGAAQIGAYWAVFDHLPERERYLESASRYNGGPSMAYADNPNAANFERAWEQAGQYLVDPTAMTAEGASAMPEFLLGFADLAAQLGPDVVGEPVEDEQHLDALHSYQTTTTGVMWFASGGSPLFLGGETR